LLYNFRTVGFSSMSKDSLEYMLVPLFLFANAVVQARAQQDLPSDKNATKETIHLYNNLKKLAAKGFMFGHQDDLAYGVGWKYDASASSAGRSDIKDVTGDYPAVYGWELGHLEMDNPVNLDSVPYYYHATADKKRI
jgi:hypothetical protein